MAGLRCCTDHPPHLPSIPIHPLAHARCPPLPIPWRRRAANHHSDHHSVPVKHPTVSCGRRAHAGRPSSSSSPSANITMSLRGSRTRFSRGARRPIGDGAVEYSTAGPAEATPRASYHGYSEVGPSQGSTADLSYQTLTAGRETYNPASSAGPAGPAGPLTFNLNLRVTAATPAPPTTLWRLTGSSTGQPRHGSSVGRRSLRRSASPHG